MRIRFTAFLHETMSGLYYEIHTSTTGVFVTLFRWRHRQVYLMVRILLDGKAQVIS